MRYIVFCVLFLFLIFCSFWIFVWTARTDIVASLLERSCPPCKVHVDHIEWISKGTLSLSGVHIHDQNNQEVVHIINAELTASSLSWAHWFLIPSKKPLSLVRARIHIEKALPYKCESPKTPVFVVVDEVILVDKKGNEKVAANLSGPLSEVLIDLFGSV